MKKKIEQNLYYIYKIPSNKIKNLEKYSFKEARENGDIVAIGDNLVISTIQQYHKNNKTPEQLFNEVEDIRKEIKRIKKLPSSKQNGKKINELYEKIDRTIFIDDIINIKVKSKKEYREISKNGFNLNNRHYVRFLCGSGQMRRNTITFVDERLKDFLEKRLMCGLQGKLDKINLAKLSAYYALSMSSVIWVNTPRVCIIKDFENVIKNQKVNFIDKNNNIQEEIKDFTINCADGQGLITPEMADIWSQNMKLDYTACSFIVRTCWIKGAVHTFDFREYAKTHGINIIKDRWGKEYDINEIDILISESQFKMHKYYNSWEEYLNNFQKYNLKWGVARVNKEQDDEYVLTNYQYLQALDMKKEDVEELTEYTKKWIKSICSGEDLYTLAFNVGISNPNLELESILNGLGSTFTKMITKNQMFLQDNIVKKKIYNSIKESIRKAKIGKVWVRGNYQFIISDPIQQCRAALGMEINSTLPSNTIYSNWWNKRTTETELILCRSPLTIPSEICKVNLFTEFEHWYKYLYTGLILSVEDINTIRCSDCDFDGDIMFSTNNPVFVRCKRADDMPVSYEKQQVETKKVTLGNQIKTDCKGLDTKVGLITNYSTSMYALLSNFENKELEYKELYKRILITRKLQGEEIDKIKGTSPPKIPSYWHRKQNIEENDTEEIKEQKYFNNSLLANKKPYFFIWLYPSLKKEYMQYCKSFNSISLKKLGCTIKDLLYKENKSKQELELYYQYQKYNPVIESNCSMNILCREFEKLENSIKFSLKNTTILEQFADRNIDFDNKEKVLQKVYTLVKEYKTHKKLKYLDNVFEEDETTLFNQIYYRQKEFIKTNYQRELYKMFSCTRDLFDVLCMMCDKYNMNYDVIWEIMQDDIVELIPKDNPTVVVEDSNGIEYLGRNLSLEAING